MPNWFHRKALFFQSNILNCTTLSISRKKSSFWSKTCYSKLVLIDFTKKNLNSRCFWPRCFNGHAVLTNAILTTCHFDHLLFCPQAVLTWWNFDPRSFGRRNFVWRYYFRPPTFGLFWWRASLQVRFLLLNLCQKIRVWIKHIRWMGCNAYSECKF